MISAGHPRPPAAPGRIPGLWSGGLREWRSGRITPTSRPFERTSKRRKGYPSETRVKRGTRMVHGDKELIEKLGRNDLCPCGSGRRFQAVLPSAR